MYSEFYEEPGSLQPPDIRFPERLKNAFSENVSNNKVTTKDYVYLLSSDELSLFRSY